MPLGREFDEVLAAAQAGGEWAFTRLYRELNPALVRYLTAQSGTAGEDLAADTWLAAARQLPTFSGSEAAFRGWIFTIARRQLVGHWRTAGRRRTTPAPPEAFAELVASATSDDPEAAGVAGVSARQLASAIAAALSPDQADVVLLRMVAGLDVDQVAEVLGKRAGTVRALQHKGLRRLAQIFSEEALTP